MNSPLHEEDQGSYDFPLLDGPAFRAFERHIAESEFCRAVQDDDGYFRYEVRKHAIRMPVSTDVAMDAGLIPDTRPRYVPGPPLWHWRLRAWLSDTVWAVRYRVGYWLIGGNPDA